MSAGTAVVIGAGPAGLTAALELRRRSDMRVVVLEASGDVGGISKTVNHRGYRIDLGGHRFFSKSDWVMNWWQELLPLQPRGDGGGRLEIAYQNRRRTVELPGRAPRPEAGGGGDAVMLVRDRLSRIYFMRKFFPYPVKMGFEVARKLGPARVGRILGSYARARAFPRRPEATLEDFLLNRFGRELYETFFKDYTEKVWGVPCAEISAEWGAQRIKGLSITRALAHAVRSSLQGRAGAASGLPSRSTETSLIERFLYPKYGPGQMWEAAAERAVGLGGEIRLHHRAVRLERNCTRIKAVTALDTRTGAEVTLPADYVISTMPVVDLIGGMAPDAPAAVRRVADGLQYRDFITVGLLLRKLRRTEGALPGSPTNLVPDNWIYIQDQGVRVGRLQFFNNWSPYMVGDPGKVWVGLEYFCREGDSLWGMADDELAALGAAEMAKIGLAEPEDLLDSVVIRVPKAYPGYFGSYGEFRTIREFTDSFRNLFLVGRNGMHRYNNQDHSMLTARHAVEAILAGSGDKSALWDVNAEGDYHEEK